MKSNNDVLLLTRLVSIGLKIGHSSLKSITTNISVTQWQHIYQLAQEQGVLAIVFDALSDLSIANLLPKSLKFKWIGAVDARERTYQKQLHYASELARAFKLEGISTTALKGVSFASYYPIPAHREFGDFDCFLGEKYELGNRVAENLGARVERDYYRHSHIYYKQQLVENHQFCVGVRGSNRMKKFEKHLQSVMHNQTDIIDGILVRPSPDFNALFLISHAMTHFLVEGIKLRHICDWALLLHHEQDSINWSEFYKWTDELHYTKFATALTSIAVNYFSLNLHNSEIKCTEEYELIMEDVFCQNSLFNKGYGVWKSRIISVKNRIYSHWKFRKIYQRSMFAVLFEQATGFIFDRNPTI